MSQTKKYLVLDTSVLLYDKESIYNFGENDIIIPLIVLEELDKFKDKPGVLGENARHVNRTLDNLRNKGKLSEGVEFKEDSNAKISVATKIINTNEIDTFGRQSNDNIILATALHVRRMHEYSEVKVITKDINLRVKCDALGVNAEDYYADHKFIKEDQGLYKGFTEIIVDAGLISSIYGNKSASLSEDIISENELNQNQFLVLKTETNQSALCIFKDNEAILLPSKDEIYKKTKIMPKNKEQIFSLYLLCYCDIPLVSMTGVPGSGKTYLALMTALKFLESKSHNRIIFTRPIQTVGKDMGFLPGDMNEKMAPWLAPIVDNFRNEFGDLSYFEMLMDKGQIDVAPLAYIRGRSFNDAIIIVDESQNATIHELKTVITRTGKNSKIILIGDTDQIDLQYVDKISNGLTIVVEKMKNEQVTGHVNFEKGYRSDLANAAAKLL